MSESTQNVPNGDFISRKAAIEMFEPWLKVQGYSDGELNMLKAILYELKVMPAAPGAVEGGRMMDDYISRQAAIDAVREYIVPRDKCAMRDISFNDGVETAISALSVLPSAPRRWIPVSERLPEMGEAVLDDSLNLNWLSFQSDGKEWVFQRGVKAWMPLPEPYREESNV